MVRFAVLVRHHAHHLVALHFGAKRTADAAVRAGGVDAAIRHAVVDHVFFDEGGGGAGLYAGAARDAFRIEEGLRAGGDFRGKATPVDAERERALYFIAGAHAARTDDALGRVELEVGVGDIHRRIEVVGATRIAHSAQAHGAGDILQFAIAVGGAGETVERMVGDVELQHAASHASHLFGLGMHDHAFLHRLGAGGDEAAPTLHGH